VKLEGNCLGSTISVTRILHYKSSNFKLLYLISTLNKLDILKTKYVLLSIIYLFYFSSITNVVIVLGRHHLPIPHMVLPVNHIVIKNDQTIIIILDHLRQNPMDLFPMKKQRNSMINQPLMILVFGQLKIIHFVI
jgi:hypothetical protein